MTPSKRPILYAEDSPHDVEMTLAALAGESFVEDIVVVHDGAEALDYLYARGRFHGRSEGLPSFVLLDLKMPKVDGLEVLRVIRDDAALRALPVVMLTSSREERDIVRSQELGANAYIVKPVGYAEFMEAVRQIGDFWVRCSGMPTGGDPPLLTAFVRN
jgi:CheY-like chemotaxis protein